MALFREEGSGPAKASERQADTRGAEAEDSDIAGRVTGELTVEAGLVLKQAGQSTREIQAGSGRARDRLGRQRVIRQKATGRSLA